jgi:hypothetical protein
MAKRLSIFFMLPPLSNELFHFESKEKQGRFIGTGLETLWMAKNK